MLRKLEIAIDCANDQERDQVQQILYDISNQRILSGEKMVQMYPFIKAHQYEVIQLFKLIKSNGVSALLSIQGARLIKSLVKK